MPILYDFQCPSCGKTKEKLFHVDDCPESILCDCGEQTKKVLVAGHGAVMTDNKVKWLSSACMTLQREGERPLETRGDYKKYLKENNLICKG
jgi:putative FmdB family regulatory protein